jgi:hypothetical protein
MKMYSVSNWIDPWQKELAEFIELKEKSIKKPLIKMLR